MQTHPNNYLDEIFALSEEQLRTQAARECEGEFEIMEDTLDLVCKETNTLSINNMCCDYYILAGDNFHSKPTGSKANYELIEPLFQKYQTYDANIQLRIFGNGKRKL